MTDLIPALNDYHVISNIVIHDLLNPLPANLPSALHLSFSRAPIRRFHWRARAFAAN